MKVALIEALAYPSSYGGCEIHAQRLAEQLIKLNYDVKIFAANATEFSQLHSFHFTSANLPQKETVNRVVINRFPLNKTLGSILFNKKLSSGKWVERKIFKKIIGDYYSVLSVGPLSLHLLFECLRFRPDVIISMNIYCAHNIFALIASYILNIPLVLIPLLHTNLPDIKNKALWNILRKSDLIITNTQHEKKFLAMRNINDNKITVGGVGSDCVNGTRHKVGRFRKNFNLEGYPIVAYVGRIFPMKGIELLIDAMLHIWKYSPKVRLVLAGKSTPHVSVIKKRINKLPKTHREKVLLILNFQESEKSSIYQDCDVFAMPSKCDSFGISYLDAWMHNKPIIASKNTAQEEIIEHGKNGFLVSDNPEEISEVIITLLKTPSLRGHIGKEGRKKALQKYTWKITSKKVHKALNKLVKKN